jgi:hypothetical protein
VFESSIAGENYPGSGLVAFQPITRSGQLFPNRVNYLVTGCQDGTIQGRLITPTLAA